ncbi:MAG: DUF4012 domain-containing protein [Candidatus Moranbacteria bacterium]|nr:DUF4012 domain-containing protein [Candidatus Moranbacteria bacterium]
MPIKRKNILPQMFDVKPVNKKGVLDLERIKKGNRVIIIRKEKPIQRMAPKIKPIRKPETAKTSLNFIRPYQCPAILPRPKPIQTEKIRIQPAINTEKAETRPQSAPKTFTDDRIIYHSKPFISEEVRLRIERDSLEKENHLFKAEKHPRGIEHHQASKPFVSDDVQLKIEESSIGMEKVSDFEARPEKVSRFFEPSFENYSPMFSREEIIETLPEIKPEKPKTEKKELFKAFFEKKTEKLREESEIRKKKAQTKPKKPFFSRLFEEKKRKKKISRKSSLNSGFSKLNRELGKVFSLETQRKIAPVPKMSYGFSFAVILLVISLTVPTLSYIQRALNMKNSIEISGQEALGQIAEAKDNLTNSQFEKAAVDFSESYEILSEADKNIRDIGGGFSDVLRFVPGISRLASAQHIVSAGEHFSLAGKSLSESAKSLNSLGNPLADDARNQPSLTDLFLNLRDGVEKASNDLSQGTEDINKVNIDDLPADMRGKFTDLKSKLPLVNASLKNFLDYSRIFLDVLGYNGPRKYLFLFENNQEMRATGGFIGSYGILDISNGRVKKLFVDDIYNPDGQLKARVIPPLPIQKMSAVWTMHDANWFPDFPTSAEKVSWFYEKTGGPTVDGVIAITPELLEDLLKITGPIEMDEYGKTIDANNFIKETQQEVEVDYDKKLNQPKKFVADLTPKILDKVMSEKGITQLLSTLQAFSSALEQKHLLLYSRNYNIQKLISGQKWSGEILNTDKDYLSVINTNINGYKTDGIVDETIDHQSEIQDDGTVVDTVAVTRKHNGGNEKYDWWNKVNGDWMRIYVPEGAKLLEVSGQTRETNQPALDYDTLGFKKDPQVQANEDSAEIDEESGTRIYKENNKTVFANWVYVSPGESVTISYKYVLPFKLGFDPLHHPADSFSVLYQKQSGSVGSELHAEVKLPDNMHSIWRWPDGLKQDGNSYKMEGVLDTDKFVGLAVEKQ